MHLQSETSQNKLFQVLLMLLFKIAAKKELELLNQNKKA